MAGTMNATTCYTVLAVFFSLSVITVFARFYTRLALLRKFSADDYILLAGFVLLVPYTAIYIRVIHYLFRVPFTQFTVVDLSNVYKNAFIMLPFYLVSSMLIKLSIALRILKFCGERPILKWLIIFALVLYEADAVVMIAINFTQCLPPFFSWAQPFKVAIGSHCANAKALQNTGWLFSALTCFLDFVLAIVPWFIVRELWRSNRRTRVMLSILLGLGSIASLATIARMFYNYQFTTLPTPDNAGNFFLWTYLELSLATIACSIATLKPLVVKIAQLTTTGSSRSRRTVETEEVGENTSGTWSAYLKHYQVGDQPPPPEDAPSEDMPPESAPSENMPSGSVRPLSGTTATSHRFQWPPRIFTSSSPRVLRHPLSFNSIRESETDSMSFSSYKGRQSGRKSKSARFSPTTTQLSTTFSQDDSSSDSLGITQYSRARIGNAQFESLNAQIQYALDDEEDDEAGVKSRNVSKQKLAGGVKEQASTDQIHKSTRTGKGRSS